MTEENEKKKAYLKEYRRHVRKINMIEEELEELRSMKASVSLNIDGMPHGSSRGDLSDYASDLDGLERELLEERYLRISAYKAIASRIKSLKSENEKDVLFYRYIRALDWWEIAEKMKYSERQVLRIHGKALANLKISKDVSECQSNM